MFARRRYVYGSELLELVGVPVLTACALDADAALRAAAARACAELAQGGTVDAHTDLIDLLEKVPRPAPMCFFGEYDNKKKSRVTSRRNASR